MTVHRLTFEEKARRQYWREQADLIAVKIKQRKEAHLALVAEVKQEMEAEI